MLMKHAFSYLWWNESLWVRIIAAGPCGSLYRWRTLSFGNSKHLIWIRKTKLMEFINNCVLMRSNVSFRPFFFFYSFIINWWLSLSHPFSFSLSLMLCLYLLLLSLTKLLFISLVTMVVSFLWEKAKLLFKMIRSDDVKETRYFSSLWLWRSLLLLILFDDDVFLVCLCWVFFFVVDWVILMFFQQWHYCKSVSAHHCCDPIHWLGIRSCHVVSTTQNVQ